MKERTIIYFGNVLYPDLDAASHRIIGNAKVLRELDYKVVLVGTKKGETRPILKTKEVFEGFEVYYFSDPETSQQWRDYLFGFSPLKKIIEQQNNVDSVILYNHPSISSKKILAYCKTKGIKVYVDCTEWFDPKGFSMHNIIKKADTWYRMRCVNKNLDGVIAISSFLQNYYSNKGCKTICVPPLVDLRQEKWKLSETDLIKNKFGKKLVYVGNPGAGTKDKLALIITALSIMLRKHPDVAFNLDIIGMTKEQFEDVFRMNIEGCSFVKFLGRKSNAEALSYIKQSDYTVFLRDNNLICTAGFPTKFSESIACGTPVLTNLTSDLGKYLIDGSNGFTMDVSSEMALVESLYKALTISAKQMLDMKRYCREEKTFDYHSFTKEFVKMF